jgi:hypothetical protein
MRRGETSRQRLLELKPALLPGQELAAPFVPGAPPILRGEPSRQEILELRPALLPRQELEAHPFHLALQSRRQSFHLELKKISSQCLQF